MTIDRSLTERRCSPRLPISLPAEMGQEVQTVNLGCLGVFLEYNEKRAVGEPLRFFVTLPDSDGNALRVECHGVVIHCEACQSRSGLGVRIHGAWLVGEQENQQRQEKSDDASREI
ncbi:MAG: PilZ domain-containing protein [Acidobacteria bacterium]|nr:PilZ domain-containing protein [Acidobacteriota bacterium]